MSGFFSVKGIDAFEEWQKRIEKTQALFKLAVQDVANKALAYALELVPVDDGELLASLRVNVYWETDTSVLIVLSSDCPHAEFNEYGWIRVEYGGTDNKPKFYKGGYRPFGRPAMLKVMKEFNKQFKKLFTATMM